MRATFVSYVRFKGSKSCPIVSFATSDVKFSDFIVIGLCTVAVVWDKYEKPIRE
jgi:hypothetical protein